MMRLTSPLNKFINDVLRNPSAINKCKAPIIPDDLYIVRMEAFSFVIMAHCKWHGGPYRTVVWTFTYEQRHNLL
jgi:hypothetical protein